jgi:RNA polymerase sigma-70 factor (ECF subfamily)
MLLHDARRDARLDDAGDIVLLEHQDRSRWDRDQIAEALPMVEEAFQRGAGPFTVQAAIAAEHCRATRAEDTDWPQILRLYDLLQRLQPPSHRGVESRGSRRHGAETGARACISR